MNQGYVSVKAVVLTMYTVQSKFQLATFDGNIHIHLHPWKLRWNLLYIVPCKIFRMYFGFWGFPLGDGKFSDFPPKGFQDVFFVNTAIRKKDGTVGITSHCSYRLVLPTIDNAMFRSCLIIFLPTISVTFNYIQVINVFWCAWNISKHLQKRQSKEFFFEIIMFTCCILITRIGLNQTCFDIIINQQYSI